MSGMREPCRVATTAALDTTTSQGVDYFEGLQTIDDVELEEGDRVLVKDNTIMNGIYVASAGLWVRAPDADSSRLLDKGTMVVVQSGTVNEDRVYAFATLAPVIDEDTIALTLFATIGA